MVVLLCTAYMAMTTAAAMHQLAHGDHHAAGRAAQTGVGHADAGNAGGDHGVPVGEGKRDFCFLCAYNPMTFVMLFTALTVAVIAHRTFRYRSLPSVPYVRFSAFMPSLRAPPALVIHRLS